LVNFGQIWRPHQKPGMEMGAGSEFKGWIEFQVFFPQYFIYILKTLCWVVLTQFWVKYGQT